MFYYRKDSRIVLLIILGLAIVILWVISSIHSSSEYNNGICKWCGGNFVYQQAVGYRHHDTSYIYICDKCGHMIEINYYATPYDYDEPRDETVENLDTFHEDFVAE